MCPCDETFKGSWDGLSAADLTTYKRKPVTTDFEAAKAEPITDPLSLFFSNVPTVPAVYTSWLGCYKDMKAGTGNE